MFTYSCCATPDIRRGRHRHRHHQLIWCCISAYIDQQLKVVVSDFWGEADSRGELVCRFNYGGWNADLKSMIIDAKTGKSRRHLTRN